MIAIIDYGAGNLKSVQHALSTLGFTSTITSDPNHLDEAEKLILPGVGSFGDAMEELEKRGLVDVLKQNVIAGKPILGICLGLQVFYETGHENGKRPGLGFLEGEVVRFNHGLKIPHIGWNNMGKGEEGDFARHLTEKDYVYFVHSYYVQPKNRREVLYWTEYGVEFPAIVKKNNIIGMQFHPEKSGKVGLELLKRFGEMRS